MVQYQQICPGTTRPHNGKLCLSSSSPYIHQQSHSSELDTGGARSQGFLGHSGNSDPLGETCFFLSGTHLAESTSWPKVLFIGPDGWPRVLTLSNSGLSAREVRSPCGRRKGYGTYASSPIVLRKGLVFSPSCIFTLSKGPEVLAAAASQQGSKSKHLESGDHQALPPSVVPE